MWNGPPESYRERGHWGGYEKGNWEDCVRCKHSEWEEYPRYDIEMVCELWGVNPDSRPTSAPVCFPWGWCDKFDRMDK